KENLKNASILKNYYMVDLWGNHYGMASRVDYQLPGLFWAFHWTDNRRYRLGYRHYRLLWPWYLY
ncbi:MAG: hypothetical protein ABGX68_06040, partial [Methylococcales bacterium]